ncbi:hypothetical protein PNOK_0866100 [Pyrrhoderma noxium]|uniref:Uncharacterized protein n=1 Tax=Pyrrhoderma noxium TaxID=2282107 RepID=A0A286U877_9AGAM|nr:hypothetical protein PNOK_0866100 [Pyrrhoderma noxium]
MLFSGLMTHFVHFVEVYVVRLWWQFSLGFNFVSAGVNVSGVCSHVDFCWFGLMAFAVMSDGEYFNVSDF